jgi:hypothetical protein
MRQHLHMDVLSSILSTLQPRSRASQTTHLGKIKAYNNFKGNDLADHHANIVADGQPPYALYSKGAHKHIGLWTWPYTTQLDDPNPPMTLTCTSPKHGARKYNLAYCGG